MHPHKERKQKLAVPVAAVGTHAPFTQQQPLLAGNKSFRGIYRILRRLAGILPSVAPLLHCDIFHIPTAWDKRTSWSLEDGGPMVAGVR